MKIPLFRFRNTKNPSAKNTRVWQNFLANPPASAKATVGRPAFPELLNQNLNKLEKWSKTERKKWKHILVLGIGGSSLGAQALISALAQPPCEGGSPRLAGAGGFYFLDNLDPVETSSVFEKLNWKKTLVLVITKSGGTLETLAQFSIVKKELGQNWKKQIIVITDPQKGFLRELAQKEKLSSFDVPPEVGGRYSVLSNVGLVPAALSGISVEKLLKGANQVKAKQAFEFAKIQAAEYRKGRNITIFCPYSSQLKKLGEWYAQLLAESIGKNLKTGITPEVSIGATDQHSKLQLWSDGPNDKFFIFLKVKKFSKDIKNSKTSVEPKFIAGKTFSEILNAECEATIKSLSEKKRPIVKIEIPEINEESLGYLLYFFQLQVAFLGQILGVNPFDQPGVERGKILAQKQLSRN